VDEAELWDVTLLGCTVGGVVFHASGFMGLALGFFGGQGET